MTFLSRPNCTLFNQVNHVIIKDMKKILTATDLAKLRKVSVSYICRLCRLPKDHPKYIENIKIHRQLYLITDKKILEQYPEKYCSEL